jgi:hypothetical protein
MNYSLRGLARITSPPLSTYFYWDITWLFLFLFYTKNEDFTLVLNIMLVSLSVCNLSQGWILYLFIWRPLFLFYWFFFLGIIISLVCFIVQALQLGQDAYELRSQRCQMCLRSDSLHKVIERLANPGWLVFLCLDETFSFNFLVDVTISDRVADRIVQGYLLSTFVCIFQYFVTPNLHWIWRVENFSDIF